MENKRIKAIAEFLVATGDFEAVAELIKDAERYRFLSQCTDGYVWDSILEMYPFERNDFVDGCMEEKDEV